jgi:hypothetical protein
VLTALSDTNDSPAWASHAMKVDFLAVEVGCGRADAKNEEADLTRGMSTPGVATDSTVEDIAVMLICSRVAAGLSVAELPSSGTSLSLEPQITRRIGKSFGQLLTKRAVLIAFGLAGSGGVGGNNCAGAVEIRLSGGPDCGVGVEGDALVG